SGRSPLLRRSGGAPPNTARRGQSSASLARRPPSLPAGPLQGRMAPEIHGVCSTRSAAPIRAHARRPGEAGAKMAQPLPVAVIGAGHMGRHHVRKYHEMPQARLVAVIDTDVERARALAEPLGARYAAELTPDLG